MLAKLLLLVLFHTSSAVIYELNDSDYALMPPMFLLDDYEACLTDTEELYCTAKFALVSDEPSPLLTMIQEFSEHRPTHYNHTLLYRGVCITQTCKKFYEKLEGDLGSALEACANETLYNKYKLKTSLSNGFHCSKREKNQPIDYVDTAVGMVCVAIFFINMVASVFDYTFEKGKDSAGLRFLYCFSIFRNWNKLVAPATDGREPHLKVLKGLHGIRTMTMMLVIAGHSIAIHVFIIENPMLIENMFINDAFHILLNGTLIMQTFLVTSSFLNVYMMQIHLEKHELSWQMLPRVLLMRWLRLTTSYAVIVALTATWFGRLTSGPYWKKVIGDEMTDCRRYWWMHLLYVNNFFDESKCMVHSWYLAADFQLYCMAAIFFVMCRTPRFKKVVLCILFVLGVVIPTLKTYYLNLDGVLIVTPDFALDIFQNSPTFDEVYKRGHTNLAGYVLGMALGYWFYDWQKAGSNPKTFRKYQFLYWTLFPLLFLCCYSGTIFYSYSAAPSLIVHLLYAAFLKPTFALLMCLFIGGIITQFEDLYRPIFEWPVWTIPSRLSFSAYLLHFALIRNFLGMQTTTYRGTSMVLVTRGAMLIISAFICAFFFWILVENPFRNVIREWLTSEVIKKKTELNTDSTSEVIKENKKLNGFSEKKEDGKSPKKKN